MAAYNASLFIEDAIESVLRQSHKNLELLVVNDGSSDNTEELVLKARMSESRIRYFKQDNAGVSSARNVGLREMRGDFFCFLDADDVFPPTSIAERLNHFQDEISFVDGRVEIYDEDYKKVLREWSPSLRGNVLSDLVRLKGGSFFGPTWMVRRDAKQTYEFDTQLTHGEDLLFYISIAAQGNYTFTNEVILRYRKSSSSAMSNVFGLAHGYHYIGRRLGEIEGVGKLDKLVFGVKVRKIMFLTLARKRKLWLAVKFLISGSV